MDIEQKKLKKKIRFLRESIEILETTGDDKRFLELSKSYQSERKRIQKEILRRYSNLFATIHNVRELSVLGVQNVDLLFEKNEVDFSKCIKRYHALQPMMIKYRDILDEIICLTENGFTDGAMQRWRTFFEYSVIIVFILQQGEEVAEAYTNNCMKSIEDELHPRTNFAWAKASDCLKEEKQINIKMLLNNIDGIDTTFKQYSLANYKLVSQSLHGSSFGINISFNDYMSERIDDLHTKNADYYRGGVCTVVSNTMNLFFRTYLTYFNIFPEENFNFKDLLKPLQKEYVKVFKTIDCNDADYLRISIIIGEEKRVNDYYL